MQSQEVHAQGVLCHPTKGHPGILSKWPMIREVHLDSGALSRDSPTGRIHQTNRAHAPKLQYAEGPRLLVGDTPTRVRPLGEKRHGTMRATADRA
eukprot:794548-Amphidinium_carterae.1